MSDIEVKIGEIEVIKSTGNLLASGVGSCLIITLYDPKRKIGALAHTMLANRRSSLVVRRSNPESPATNNESQDTRYVDSAIEEMLKRMKAQGTKREVLEAKLIGGANMFSAFESDIGKENVLSAKKKLKKEGIKLVGETVGGSQGRSVEFSVASGIVTVKVKF